MIKWLLKSSVRIHQKVGIQYTDNLLETENG